MTCLIYDTMNAEFSLQFIVKDFLFVPVSSGCFVYDADLKTEGWVPTKQELMVISAAMHKMAEKSLPMERLVVDAKLAQEMFEDNR